MSILTFREIEFLASLKTRWNGLYCNELARLLKGDGNPSDVRRESHFVAAASGCSEGFIPCQVGKSRLSRQNAAIVPRIPDASTPPAPAPEAVR